MSDSVRVLAVTNTYPTAARPGDSPQIYDQLGALRKRGVQVEVLYIDRYRGIRAYARTAVKILGLSVQRRHYDLIHAYYGHSGLIARLQIKVPLVVTFLGSDLLHPRDRRIGWLAARLADGVIVQSEEMKRAAGREDALILPFGLNLNLFRPYPVEEARQALGLGMEEKLVLFPWDPARAVKRFDIVQAAVQILAQRFQGVRLVAVFDRPHEMVAKYMNACDVMALASDHEGAPMALREAMACNLPVVAVDVGDVAEVMAATSGCYLCRRDPADLAEKLGWVLEEGRRTDGRKAICEASAGWGADQVLELYRRVLAARGGYRSQEKPTSVRP